MRTIPSGPALIRVAHVIVGRRVHLCSVCWGAKDQIRDAEYRWRGGA